MGREIIESTLLTAQRTKSPNHHFPLYLQDPRIPFHRDQQHSLHPGVSAGPSHLGSEKFHGPQPERRLSPKHLYCFKHQGLVKHQRAVIPECH